MYEVESSVGAKIGEITGPLCVSNLLNGLFRFVMGSMNMCEVTYGAYFIRFIFRANIFQRKKYRKE